MSGWGDAPLTEEELARAYGVLGKHRANSRGRSYTLAQAEAMAAAYRNGATLKQLSANYGLPWWTVRRAIKKGGEPRVMVTLARWRAEFSITDEGPVQTSPWVAA